MFEAATAVSPVSLEEEALPAEADGEVVELEEESSAFSSTLDEVQLRLPHKLDKFQRRAVKAVLAGKSCVVCAPTGSGKTLIAEAAIVATLAAGKRAFYTTPLKALSNQKLREFSERFGSAAVGLRTGDTSINPDARLVVMTTEILRSACDHVASLRSPYIFAQTCCTETRRTRPSSTPGCSFWTRCTTWPTRTGAPCGRRAGGGMRASPRLRRRPRSASSTRRATCRCWHCPRRWCAAAVGPFVFRVG